MPEELDKDLDKIIIYSSEEIKKLKSVQKFVQTEYITIFLQTLLDQSKQDLKKYTPDIVLEKVIKYLEMLENRTNKYQRHKKSP